MSTETTANQTTSPTTTSTPANPIKKFGQVIFRENFSLDDAEAWRLLNQRQWNTKYNLSGCEIRFAENILDQADADTYWDALETLPVGFGGGRFGQIGEFSCALVAKELSTTECDLVRDRALQLIRREIIRPKGSARLSRLSLPRVLQMLHHRVLPGEAGKRWLLNWAAEQLTTINKGMLVGFIIGDGEKTLMEILENMATPPSKKKASKEKAEPKFPDQKALETLRAFVKESMDNQNESHLELSSLVAAMFRTRPTSVPAADVILKVEYILSQCYAYQVAFQAAIEEAKTGQTFKVREKGDPKSKEREFSFLVLETNNELVIPASQTEEGGNHALVLLKDEQGNVIFKLGSWVRGTSLANLAKLIVVLSLKKRKKPVNRLTLGAIGKPGQLKGADQWHFNDWTQVLSNGFGKSNVPSTTIELKDLALAGINSFHHELFFAYLKKLGVTIRKPLNKIGDAIKKNEPKEQFEGEKAA